MSLLDSKIDEIYRGPLNEFVANRRALAKTTTGDGARRVKALQKPTVVPWAVNQVYWRARPVYDRLIASGEKLRAAQISALKGRPADIRGATDAHRKAMAAAVTEALRLASAAGAHPGADELTKTLEAVSLARELPDPPGRLTRALRPAGFEALAGVPVKAIHDPAPPPRPTAKPITGPTLVTKTKPIASNSEAKNRRKEEAKEEATERARKKTLQRATTVAARAKAEEARARAAWERAKEALAAAELAVSSLQRT